jgi:hypothetical protein
LVVDSIKVGRQPVTSHLFYDQRMKQWIWSITICTGRYDHCTIKILTSPDRVVGRI